MLHKEINEIVRNFQEEENYDLVLTLCWAVGEFLQSYQFYEIQETEYSYLDSVKIFTKGLQNIVLEMEQYFEKHKDV